MPNNDLILVILHFFGSGETIKEKNIKKEAEEENLVVLRTYL